MENNLRAQREGNARLSRSDVIKIRELGKDWPARTIAKVYGVGAETIRRVLRGETWGWLSDDAGQPAAQSAQNSLERLLARNPDLLQQAAGNRAKAEEPKVDSEADKRLKDLGASD